MRLLYIFLICLSTVLADVKSQSGTINFNVNSDSNKEMILNSTGLGLGITPSENLHVQGNVIISSQLYLGATEGHSTLDINGTMGMSYEMVSSNTTLGNNTTVFVDATSDNLILSLPYAGNVEGRLYKIKKINHENTVWVSGAGNLIDGVSPIELPASLSELPFVELMSNGSNWYVLNNSAISKTVAASNLVGWWKFDETSGTTASDSSGSESDMTLTDIDFSGNGIAGKVGNGLVFDGSNDYVSGSSTNITNTAFTIAVWIKPEVFTNRTYFGLGSGASARASIHLRLTSSTSFLFGMYSDDLAVTVTDMTSRWTQLVVTLDDSFMQRVYQDGAFVDDRQGGGYFVGDSSMNIGRWKSSQQYVQGVIDDVRIYNRALNTGEIEALYQQGQQ